MRRVTFDQVTLRCGLKSEQDVEKFLREGINYNGPLPYYFNMEGAVVRAEDGKVLRFDGPGLTGEGIDVRFVEGVGDWCIVYKGAIVLKINEAYGATFGVGGMYVYRNTFKQLDGDTQNEVEIIAIEANKRPYIDIVVSVRTPEAMISTDPTDVEMAGRTRVIF